MSGLVWIQAAFDTLMAFLEEFLENINIEEKNQPRIKKKELLKNCPSMHRIHNHPEDVIPGFTQA